MIMVDHLKIDEQEQREFCLIQRVSFWKKKELKKIEFLDELDERKHTSELEHSNKYCGIIFWLSRRR